MCVALTDYVYCSVVRGHGVGIIDKYELRRVAYRGVYAGGDGQGC